MSGKKNAHKAIYDDKSRCMYLHFKIRMKQRTGIELTEKIYNQIIFNIHNRRATLVQRQSNNISIWDTNLSEEFNNKLIRVVYNSRHNGLSTILPYDDVGKPVEPYENYEKVDLSTDYEE